MSGRIIDTLNAARACQQNAEQFVKDVETLIEGSSFGHAFSLLVLADEEMGKSLMFTLSPFGFPLRREFIRGHGKKQFIQFAITIAWIVLDMLHLEDIMMATKERDPIEKSHQLIRILEEDITGSENQMDENLVGKTAALMIEFAGMDEKKQKGLYVDMDDNGRISSPSDISEEEVLQYLGAVKNRMSKMKHMILSDEEIQSFDEDELDSLLERFPKERLTKRIDDFVAQLENVERG